MSVTPNLGLTLPAGSDWADVEVLNGNWEKIDRQVLRAIAAAAAYDAGKTYQKGDFCTKGGLLYRANQAMAQPEEWTAGHWTAISITDVIRGLTAADVGAAPEGYGLGGNCVIIEDWNKAVKNGWYKNTTYDPENHSPDGYAWYGYVINYTDVLLIQVAYHANAISEVESAMRCCYQGSWGEWQYICPRLTTGREYHLAELYNGKPVYAKLVNLGAGLGDGEIKLVSHGVVNMRDIVSCTGSMSYSDGSNPISLPGISSDGTKTFYLGANYENVIWGAKGTDYTAYYGKALLKYTKLSD